MTVAKEDASLFTHLFHDDAIRSIFSIEQTVRYMLQVEAALALVEGELGIIPPEAAAVIADRMKTFTVDYLRLQAGIDKAGVPVKELINQLRSHVGQSAAGYIHWGATTQDIVDTALVLQLRTALAHMEKTLAELIAGLAQKADEHRGTLMAGRTHSQQAVPITFGLKAAGWLAPLLRQRTRLAQIKGRLLVVQFGGAVGTLAALGEEGPAVQQELAAVLDLGIPLGVWHTQRDAIAEFGGWLVLLTGALGKMAQDIILMAQSEVREVQESADPSRGGSSTMPQKSNPMVSEAILAIHRTNVGHLSALHNALIHEHERATHSWQVEWLNLPSMVTMTAAALNKANWLARHLEVEAGHMRANVAASNGVMLAEAASFALAQHMSRAQAQELVRQAARQAVAEDRHLIDVLREQVDRPLDWDALRDEGSYLGATNRFVDRIIESAAEA